MTETSSRKRASRAAGQAAQDHQEQQPGKAEITDEMVAEADAKAAQRTPAEPYALVDTRTYPKVFHSPQVRICVPGPDGTETVETIDHCEHMDRYGHESAKAAEACARRIAAQRGVRIGVPKA
jgi:hypothetical protein